MNATHSLLTGAALSLALAAPAVALADNPPGCIAPTALWAKHYDRQVDGVVTTDKTPTNFNFVQFTTGTYAPNSKDTPQPPFAPNTRFATRLSCSSAAGTSGPMLLSIEQTDGSDYHATYTGQWNGAVFTGTWYDNVGSVGDVRAYSLWPNADRDYILDSDGRCLTAQGDKVVLAPCGASPPRWHYFNLRSGGPAQLRSGNVCVGLSGTDMTGPLKAMPCDHPDAKIRWMHSGTYSTVAKGPPSVVPGLSALSRRGPGRMDRRAAVMEVSFRLGGLLRPVGMLIA